MPSVVPTTFVSSSSQETSIIIVSYRASSTRIVMANVVREAGRRSASFFFLIELHVSNKRDVRQLVDPIASRSRLPVSFRSPFDRDRCRRVVELISTIDARSRGDCFSGRDDTGGNATPFERKRTTTKREDNRGRRGRGETTESGTMLCGPRVATHYVLTHSLFELKYVRLRIDEDDAARTEKSDTSRSITLCYRAPEKNTTDPSE